MFSTHQLYTNMKFMLAQKVLYQDLPLQVAQADILLSLLWNTYLQDSIHAEGHN